MAGSRIEFSWKRRPSEIRGYDRAMYTTLNNGDYIRVDYNVGEKRVRLYVEVNEENNASYHSIITGGRIISEKNSSGKSARVADKISERSEEFSTLPNNEVLGLISRNYGIESANDSEERQKEQKKKEQLSSVRQRYFKQEEHAENIYAPRSEVESKRFSKIQLIDLFDSLTGIAIAGIFFILNQYSFLALGASAVIWGILLGIFDIFLRNREPVFMKILFFLIAGSVFYIYEYFYI